MNLVQLLCTSFVQFEIVINISLRTDIPAQPPRMLDVGKVDLAGPFESTMHVHKYNAWGGGLAGNMMGNKASRLLKAQQTRWQVNYKWIEWIQTSVTAHICQLSTTENNQFHGSAIHITPFFSIWINTTSYQTINVNWFISNNK